MRAVCFSSDATRAAELHCPAAAPQPPDAPLQLVQQQRCEDVIGHRLGLAVLAVDDQFREHLGDFLATNPYCMGLLPSSYACL